MCKAYHALYQDTGLNVVWASALSFGEKYSMAQQLPALVQFCWHGGFVKLKQLLIRASVEWKNIARPGMNCHLGSKPFSKEEVAQTEEDERTWMDMEAAREGIERAIGVENDGWVRNEEYERAVRVNEELCMAWVESLGKVEKKGLRNVDPTEIWPFKVESKLHGM